MEGYNSMNFNGATSAATSKIEKKRAGGSFSKYVKKFLYAKVFIIGIIIGALLFSGFSVIADTTLLARLSTSSFFIDGKEIKAEAYMIEGANYFKLRDLAKALDIGVWYDDRHDLVYLETDIGYDPNYNGLKNYNNLPSAISLRKSATVYVDNKKNFDLELSQSQSFTATVSIINVIRGEAAAEFIENANVYNPSAGAGKEFILAWVRAKVIDSKDNANIMLSDIRMNFQCYSSDGLLQYPMPNPLNINPINEQPKTVGDMAEGWIAFSVHKNETKPLAYIGELTEGRGGAWFALYD